MEHINRYYIVYGNKSRYIYAPTRETAILQASIYGIKRSQIKHVIKS